MPNRKDLKKSINSICSDVFAECVATSLYCGNTNKANVDSLLASILDVWPRTSPSTSLRSSTTLAT